MSKIIFMGGVPIQDTLFLGGLEPPHRKARRQHKVVDDNYVLQTGEIDVTTVTNWQKVWDCRWSEEDNRFIKEEMQKVVTTMGGFSNLSEDEKIIAAKNNIGTVVQQRDVAPNEDTLRQWGDSFGRRMEATRHNRAETARTMVFKNCKGITYEVAPGQSIPVILLVFQKIGGYLDAFIDHGIFSLAEDGTLGIDDVIMGTPGTMFENDGLIHQPWPLVANSVYQDCNDLFTAIREKLITKGIKRGRRRHRI
jgi:hypothetical protein